MKKVLMLGVAVLSLAACGTEEEQGQVEEQEQEGEQDMQELRVQTGEQETVSVEGGEVHLSFSEEETTLAEGDSLEVVLENDSDLTLNMGREYYVEYSENGDSWTQIDLPLAFTADIVMVEAFSEHVFEMLLIPEGDGEETNRPEYESGRYRLRKEFSMGENTAINENDISVEFDLEVE